MLAMSNDDTAITPRTEALPPPGPGDHVALARALVREALSVSLATLDPTGGHPFVSLATVATDFDGVPILLASRLALHSRNMQGNARISLLFQRNGKGDPLAHPRLTVSGLAQPVQAPHLRGRFLARHPKAALYIDFPDFSFWRVQPQAAHLVAGFGRAPELDGAALLTDTKGAEALMEAEASAVSHMNADHADAIALYAGCPGPWRMAGLDPEGMDLLTEGRGLRVLFPGRINDSGTLRQVLARMAQQARAEQKTLEEKGDGAGDGN
jgi:putative heme iron utilization protein